MYDVFIGAGRFLIYELWRKPHWPSAYIGRLSLVPVSWEHSVLLLVDELLWYAIYNPACLLCGGYQWPNAIGLCLLFRPSHGLKLVQLSDIDNEFLLCVFQIRTRGIYVFFISPQVLIRVTSTCNVLAADKWRTRAHSPFGARGGEWFEVLYRDLSSVITLQFDSYWFAIGLVFSTKVRFMNMATLQYFFSRKAYGW